MNKEDLSQPALELQTRLYYFADMNAQGQAIALRGTGAKDASVGLFQYINEVVTPDVLNELACPKFNEKLIAAMRYALTTPINLADDNPDVMRPWRGSATIAAIGTDGRFFGFQSIRPTDMRRYDGGRLYNIAPATVAKAVAEKYLQTAEMTGGIAENMEDLYWLGFHNIKGKRYHAGAVRVPDVSKEISGYQLGASCCEMKREAVSRILGGGLPNFFAQAGAGDQALAEMTAFHLEAPENTVRFVPRTSRTFNAIIARN